MISPRSATIEKEQEDYGISLDNCGTISILQLQVGNGWVWYKYTIKATNWKPSWMTKSKLNIKSSQYWKIAE